MSTGKNSLIEKYSFINMVNAWNENQDIIQDYLRNKENYADFNMNYPQNQYNSNSQNVQNDKKVLGMAIGIFVFIFLLMLVVFIFAVYLLIVNWKKLPDWAKAVGLISLFFFPLVTIIVVYVSKEERRER